MSYHTRALRLSARASLTAAFVLTASPGRVPGAQPSQSARETRRIEAETRQITQWRLERLKRDRPPGNSAAGRPAYQEVAEEFEQLQVVNYSLAGVAVEGAPLDFARVKREAAEVRKHAARLKVYLSLPEPKEAQRQDKGAEISTPEGLRSAVASLDALVNSFVWNPVFRRTDVVDLEQSSKAGRELAEIIALSEQIRRGAGSLGKGAGKR